MKEFFIYSQYKFILRSIICKCLPYFILRLTFLFLDGLCFSTEVFYFDVQFIYFFFSFCSCAFGNGLYLRSCPSEGHEDLLLFSSKSATVLLLTFGSMIHFEFVFMHNLRKQSHFFLYFSYMLLQLSPAPFVEKIMVYPLNDLGTIAEQLTTQIRFISGNSTLAC